MASEESFKTVSLLKSKKNRKGKGKEAPSPELVTLIGEKREALVRSGYVESCKKLLQDAWPADTLTNESLPKLSSCKKCICLGLGSLKDSGKSQLQLALLQELLSDFQLDSPVVMVEPAFTEEDLSFLTEQGFQVEEYDDTLLDLEEPTFLYTPHCPRSLYETLLQRNQGKLANMLLLGNPLEQYAERELRASELDKIPCLRSIGDKLICVDLPEYEERPDAFNDMAWQWSKSVDNIALQGDVVYT